MNPAAAAVADRLAAAGCVAAGEEAAELVAAIGGDAVALERAVVRRERGEPLAWIIGWMRFCDRPLRVFPGVFVPRPQTEELARRAAGALGRLGSVGLAADLCTGAGAVGVYLQSVVPGAGVVGVDIDRRAVTCARRNGLRVVQGDLGAPLRPRAFHVVTAVAPYVPSGALRYLPADVVRHEPPLALDGGADGLDVVRGVVEAAGRLLGPGGWLLVEVGGDQDEALLPALEVAGFGPPVTWRDEDGDLRGLEAELLARP